MNWRMVLGLVLLVAAMLSGWSAWKHRDVPEAVAAGEQQDLVLAGVALSGGVTEEHVRIALGAGAALCLVVGLAASAELSNRSAAARIGSRRPGSRVGAPSAASRSRR